VNQEPRLAPGGPGIAPRWTSSAKTGVGTALRRESRVWFTLSHGIFNEIFYPRVDLAATRDMGLIVTDGREFFSEEKRATRHEVAWLADGIPAFRLVNTCQQSRYRIEKLVLTDPRRSVLLQHTRFSALAGTLGDYHLYVLLAPHLGNHGSGNTAWLGEHRGQPVFFAVREGYALALACSVPWLKRSVGYVGTSDGWQDLSQHRQMTWEYDRAENGNLGLTGQVEVRRTNGEFTLALGFGCTAAEAAECALDSLQDGFESSRDSYVHQWQAWQKTLALPAPDRASRRDIVAASAAVLRVHESKSVPGGVIASLSVPWGFAKGDNDLGGYHLIWPRDLVEAAGGFLALGATEEAVRILRFLQNTQDADGHWPQNMWVDGSSYWQGVQLDETAFPILLVDMAVRHGAMTNQVAGEFWPMARQAALYLLGHGPVTQQDRWEEDPGYSPFTLAVTIAAFLAAAEFAEQHKENDLAAYLRETADVWNDSIERWTYVTGTDLAHRFDVEGYYVRIAPPETADCASPTTGFVPIKNRPPGQSNEPAAEIISTDALALVRFGLRAPDDPRILNTVKVIDGLLKVTTPHGAAWHRYNDDGYGEHADGAAFDGTGIGRAWPLLTGERAHYELSAGHEDASRQLLAAIEMFANVAGFISEQIWDDDDIPGRELFRGKPSGSAMPLVWAHAEYIKLRRSLQDGRVFDLPTQPVARYRKGRRPVVAHELWRFSHRTRALPAGRILRIELAAPAIVHWSADGWNTTHETNTRDTGFGPQVADLPTAKLAANSTIEFTFRWIGADRWEGRNFAVPVVAATPHWRPLGRSKHA
jgi:glucoamylase